MRPRFRLAIVAAFLSIGGSFSSGCTGIQVAAADARDIVASAAGAVVATATAEIRAAARDVVADVRASGAAALSDLGNQVKEHLAATAGAIAQTATAQVRDMADALGQSLVARLEAAGAATESKAKEGIEAWAREHAPKDGQAPGTPIETIAVIILGSLGVGSTAASALRGPRTLAAAPASHPALDKLMHAVVDKVIGASAAPDALAPPAAGAS